MLAYSGICWHIVTHINLDISWLMAAYEYVDTYWNISYIKGGGWGGLDEG